MSDAQSRHGTNEPRSGSQPAGSSTGGHMPFNADFLAQHMSVLQGDRAAGHNLHAPLGAPTGQDPHQLQHSQSSDPRLLAQSNIDARLDQQRALHAGHMPLAEGTHMPHSFPGAAAGIAAHMAGFSSADVPSTPGYAMGGFAGLATTQPQLFAQQQARPHPAQAGVPPWAQQTLPGVPEQPQLPYMAGMQQVPGQPRYSQRSLGTPGAAGGARPRRSQAGPMWPEQPGASAHAASYGSRQPPLVTDLRTCALACLPALDKSVALIPCAARCACMQLCVTHISGRHVHRMACCSRA